MVQVREQSHVNAAGEIDLECWLRQLPLALDDTDVSRLLAACSMARQAQQQPGQDTGDWARDANCFIAGLDIALILAELQVGLDCLLAGILYRAVREQRVQPGQVAEQFGGEVVELISGVLRMGAIGDITLQTDSPVLGQAMARRIISVKCSLPWSMMCVWHLSSWLSAPALSARLKMTNSAVIPSVRKSLKSMPPWRTVWVLATSNGNWKIYPSVIFMLTLTAKSLVCWMASAWSVTIYLPGKGGVDSGITQCQPGIRNRRQGQAYL